jgi:hypothetical protein
MDGVTGPAAGGVDEVNQILQVATAENIKLADKMMKVTVETALQGSEMGKGAAIDATA